MTTARNDITGDVLRTRTLTTAYSDGYDRIFGKKRQLQADIAESLDFSEDQYGPEFEDGPDEDGFKGPRPWNGFKEDAEEAHRVA